MGEESEGGPTGKVWKRAEVFSGCDTLSVLCMQVSRVKESDGFVFRLCSCLCLLEHANAPI